jgi:transformation/transcription domain-associated protein
MDLSSVPVQTIPSKSPRNSHHLDWEDLSRRLLGKDLRDALQAGKELKDRIDYINPKLLSTKVTFLLPTFSSVLNSTCRPNNDSLSNENRLRNIILEILRRIPKDELFRTHAPTIFDLCMEVLSKDYEENALLASKIIFDLHKNYRSMPQDQVQPYLDFVHLIYRSLPSSVQKNFQLHDEFINPNPIKSQFSLQDLSLSAENDSSLISPEKNDLKLGNSPSAEGQGNPPAKQGIESTLSFRVLTECPLTVMLLFQLYPKYLKSNIPTLIHLMMEALAIRLPPIQSLVKKENSKIENHHKRLYYNRSRELVSAQVKTLSFLTYLLRGFADLMKPYEDRIATNVISLMTSCPRESIGTRKELMVATRHILATDFRKGFFRHIDSLLDERILMGSHRHSDLLAMRPLGYSTLADLVHHVRAMLTIKQLSRVVSIFSRVLHDSSMNLPFSIQNTAVRLMLNVTDNIYNNKDPNGQVGRDLLDRIFASLVNKLETLQISMERIQQAGARNYTNSATNLDTNSAKVSSESNQVDINSNVHPKESVELRSESESHMERILFDPDEWMVDDQSQIDVKRDIQSMIRSIIIGLKTLIWCITNYRIPKDKEKSSSVVVDESAAPNVRFSTLERDLIEKYIDVAIPCLEFFSRNQSLSQSLSNDSSSQNNSISSDQAEKDIFTYFATSFSVLDSVNLRRTLERKIGRIVSSIVKDSNMMLFPRHLLGISARTNADVCEILLTYLVDHILCLSTFHPTDFCFLSSNEDDIDNAETMLIKRREEAKQLILQNKSISAEEQETANNSAAIHLKLFELVILSLSQFPENERILRPYLPKIVSSSLRLSLEKDDGWPDNYFTLLRLIFRSISNGKFEESYIELLPMIPTILNGLYRIYQGTEDASLQDMIIELCLTIPARLSSLLPHIPLLLRMITASLKRSDGDLVNLG